MKHKRHPEDPVGAELPRGKSAYQRKSGRDPGLTPTERHQKAQLMRQFLSRAKGAGTGNSAEFRERYDLIDWSN